MRRPSSRISPPAMRPGGSSRPMMAAPVSDLPAPDSPTTPSTSPGAMSNETSSTATSVPRRVGNSTRRSSRPRRAAARLQARRHRIQRSFGLSASRSQSPSRLTASTRITSATPGKTVIHHSPENRKSLPIADQRAERRLGRRHADAEERQRRLGDDRGRDVDRRQHQHRAQHVGQHVAAHDARAAGCRSRAPPARIPCSSRPASSRARCARTAPSSASADRDDQHGERDVVVRVARQRGARDAVDQQRDQDRRKRQLDVGDAHDEGVDAAAGVAGDAGPSETPSSIASSTAATPDAAARCARRT